jgi:flavodoxin
VEQLHDEGFFGTESDPNPPEPDKSLKDCIYFASQNGKTEDVANLLGTTTGLEVVDIQAGGHKAPPFMGDFEGCGSIMVGTPTYNTGDDDHRSSTNWDDWMYEVLPTLDISGMHVAVFCTGDQKHYDEVGGGCTYSSIFISAAL